MNKELEWLQEYVRKGVDIGGFDDEDIEMLNKIEKELKALRIFKKSCYMVPNHPFKEAALLIASKEHFVLLTQEEYDLLKEVLS